MIIDDKVFLQLIRPVMLAGLDTMENTPEFYEIINSEEKRSFLIENEVATATVKFLDHVLRNQKLTRCPECGHYNDNIECPIIRCEYCDHEWAIEKNDITEAMCNECRAHLTSHCDGKPPKKSSSS